MMMKKQIMTIAGGGSTYTPGIVQAILNNEKRLPLSEIRLYDIDEERNMDMYLIVKFMLKRKGFSNIRIRATDDPKLAFTGCDFVFSQIRVGGLEMREKDEKIPLKHGLVGQETCGLGGFAYGMRSIKGLLEIVDHIQDYAPKAWILNYTNPESIVSEAVRRKYPNVKMINACDMTISIEETIAVNYGYDRKNWIVTYYGLNHFGWYTSIYDKELQREIMPEIIEKLITKEMQVADFNIGDKTWQKTFQMMSVITKNFPSNIPNNYLEYYLYPDMVVEHTDKEYTRANMVMDGREKNTKEMADKIRRGIVEEVLNFNFGEHGQYIVDIAISLLNDDRRRFMLIVPNQGAIPNLRSDAVVEILALDLSQYLGHILVETVKPFFLLLILQIPVGLDSESSYGFDFGY
ncbi:maltose-6'-phosphate glucosidase, partial [Enterococcus faecium]|uniref:family 4 glycosyl hydrolase n=1 Tax=Enterococcus faecium TaxID=1352 RepID=UPI001F16C211